MEVRANLEPVRFFTAQFRTQRTLAYVALVCLCCNAIFQPVAPAYMYHSTIPQILWHCISMQHKYMRVADNISSKAQSAASDKCEEMGCEMWTPILGALSSQIKTRTDANMQTLVSVCACAVNVCAGSKRPKCEKCPGSVCLGPDCPRPNCPGPDFPSSTVRGPIYIEPSFRGCS